MSEAVDKAELLRSLGYGDSLAKIDPLLEEAGLSNPSKRGIDPAKQARLREIVETHFLLVCNRGDCRERARRLQGDRSLALAADGTWCAICGGSANQAAVDRMVGACCAAGWTRLCIVGGSPNTRETLSALVGGRLELRLIDGKAARAKKLAKADLGWANHVVVWGATQLAHKTSAQYTGDPKCTSLARRSITELAKHIETAAKRRTR